jgi:hypothetical protein
MVFATAVRLLGDPAEAEMWRKPCSCGLSAIRSHGVEPDRGRLAEDGLRNALNHLQARPLAVLQ